jgi:hypothetical protein
MNQDRQGESDVIGEPPCDERLGDQPPAVWSNGN